MIARGEGGVFPYVEMAKICEHRLRDPARAMRYTLSAMEYLASLPPWKERDPQVMEALEHRRRRLHGKMTKPNDREG